MVCGPYGTGAIDERDRAQNLRSLNEAALALFERGHVPLIGVSVALPIIDIAGSDRYDEVMMPLSMALAERCDAALRIGGPSAGADAEIARFIERRLPVYRSLNEVPY